MTWQVQEAKNKLSQLIDDSQSKGPQIISRHGRNTAVVMSYEQYERQFPHISVLDAIMAADLSDLDFGRDSTDIGRPDAFDFNDGAS